MTWFSKLTLVGIVFFVLFTSCHQHEEDIIETIVPVVPPPDNLCSVAFQYGYTHKLSYLPGEKVKTFLQSTENISLCKLVIFDINHKEAFAVASPLSVQQVSTNDPSVNGYGFAITSEFEIPSTTRSGIYLIENKIPIIIKTNRITDITIVYPSNTINAYSSTGGKSLYDKVDRPTQVSFFRPLSIQENVAAGLTWFSSLSSYSIGYVCDADLDDYATIQNTRVLIIAGHSEYWTRKARINFDRFVDSGRSALILSGNTMWWQVRYSGNELICYRDADKDPEADVLLQTINWDQPMLNYPIISSIGADFPRGGYGLRTDDGWDGFKIANPSSPLLEGLNLKRGDIISLPSGEYDGAPLSGFDADGYPVLDKALTDFYRLELVGFDYGSRFGKPTVGTFIVFQKSLLSGIVVNAASYDWCSETGINGKDGEKIKTITKNAIDKLLQRAPVFSN